MLAATRYWIGTQSLALIFFRSAINPLSASVLLAFVLLNSLAHGAVYNASFSGISNLRYIDPDTRETTVEVDLILSGTFDVEISPGSAENPVLLRNPHFQTAASDVRILDESNTRGEEYYYSRNRYQTVSGLTNIETKYQASSLTAIPIAFFFRTREPGSRFPIEQVEISAFPKPDNELSGLSLTEIIRRMSMVENATHLFSLTQAGITTTNSATNYYIVDRFSLTPATSEVPLPAAGWYFLTAILATVASKRCIHD